MRSQPKSSNKGSSIHQKMRVSEKYQTTQKSSRRRCGNEMHQSKYCPAKDAKCHKCSKTGHFGSMCLTKKSHLRSAWCRWKWRRLRVYWNNWRQESQRLVANNVATRKHRGQISYRHRSGWNCDPGSYVQRIARRKSSKGGWQELFGVGSKNVLPVVGMFTADLQWKTKTSTQNIYVVEGMHKALLGNPSID